MRRYKSEYERRAPVEGIPHKVTCLLQHLNLTSERCLVIVKITTTTTTSENAGRGGTLGLDILASLCKWDLMPTISYRLP